MKLWSTFFVCVLLAFDHSSVNILAKVTVYFEIKYLNLTFYFDPLDETCS